VTTSCGVLVVGNRHKLFARDLSLGYQFNFARKLRQLRSDQNHHAVVFDSAILLCVLALHVGVDRHLRNAASTNCVDEIDGNSAALVSNHINCCVTHCKIHSFQR